MLLWMILGQTSDVKWFAIAAFVMAILFAIAFLLEVITKK